MVLGSISARHVEDVDTKPKATKNLFDPAFGEEEHWGADNADDHPTTN